MIMKLQWIMLKYALQILFFISVLTASSHAEVVERIAAVVNNDVITMTDLEEEAAVRKQSGDSADMPAVLDFIIERELVSAEAGRLGLTVTINEVTNAVLLFEETFPSRNEFDRFLELYELDIQDLSRRFASSIAVDKVRQQKEAVSTGRYEKWLMEARKKADIKIMRVDSQ
ncbi:MAG: SurA N-terminal domain-containing protein [Deltaproteobacteria bacterium]|nr:SurA N-terminal domain-containing protein [Deltaproteobacteria bacterium]